MGLAERETGVRKWDRNGGAASGPMRGSSPGPEAAHPLLTLQQQVGNQAVQELLRSGLIQTKLAISQPDDPDEREADRVAQKIIRSHAGSPGSTPCTCSESGDQCEECQQKQRRIQTKRAAEYTPQWVVQRSCACGGTCTACSHSDEEHKSEVLQRRATGGAHAGAALKQIIPSDSPGHPLDDSTRSFMEYRFGSEFSDVRVHTDSRAARSAASLQADAYTTGRDIYFATGKYAPASLQGMHLLAHELTHTQQQAKGAGSLAASGAVGVIGSVHDPLEAEAERAADIVTGRQQGRPQISRDSVSAARRFPTSIKELVDDANAVEQSVVGGAKEVASEVSSGVQAAEQWAGEKIGQAEKTVADAASSAVSWLETEAGGIAQRLASSLGVGVSITSAGLLIKVPKFCPLNAMPFTFNLPSIDKNFMVPIAALPLGPVAITGEVGVAGHLQPQAQIQIGPFCLDGVTILINPITNTYSISGSVSATAAASVAAEARGGLRGQLALEGVIPIGGVPVPVKIPLLGLEGGLAGKFRGTGAGTLTIGNALTISSGTISMSQSSQVNLGLAADLFLGAYGQLDLLGQNVCRIYWQPYSWHGDVAGSMKVSVGLTISPGGSPRLIPRISPPTFSSIPFDNIPVILSRKGFSDDCPIKDRICEVLRDLHLLPSQNGGSWSWSGPYGPGRRLPGPLKAFQKNPGIPSGAQCRGACGPDCQTCKATPVYRYTDPATGDTWEYVNFRDCNSNAGCREHDAGYDWAADKHGEVGRGAIIMPWHMAANIECTCNYLTGNCVAWIAGLPPYDSKMYFADSARFVSHGGGKSVVPKGASCHTDYPNAANCMASYLDRDSVLDNWGLPKGISYFKDCVIAEAHAPGSMTQCSGGPGNIWHCHATDMGSGQQVTVSIFECICCNPDDTRSSEWLQPQIVITAGMSEELILDLCERNLIPRMICIPIEEKMIGRFGNHKRNLNLDPDKDPTAHPRPDDAPIYDSFKRIYNRFDSWIIYIHTNHPELESDFDSLFTPEASRKKWLDDLKERTKSYKDQFRDLHGDPKEAQRKYESSVLGTIEKEIDERIHKIAEWYKTKTGSKETIEDIIERVHKEGTELWRAAWRKAILQVNRVLARLWPPAKTQILVWVGMQRTRFPHIDLSGSVGELDYIGSLATGYKGPPKQQIRFNPDSFDVDANLVAPPLAKYAVAIDHERPDRGKIFGRTTSIAPLNKFSDEAQSELKARVDGYNSSDQFDVAIAADELPEQKRERVSTERLYKFRSTLSPTKYKQLLDDLSAAGFLKSGGNSVREDLSDEEFKKMNAIMDRYGP